MRLSLPLLLLLGGACDTEKATTPSPNEKDPVSTAGPTTPGTAPYTPPTTTVTTTPTTSTTSSCAVPVMDPGLMASPSDWEAPPGNVSPDIAWPVGVISGPGAAPDYIGSTLPGAYESAYWVFQAGGDFDLNLRVQNAANDFEYMHLHEAPDLCLGDQVMPLMEDVGSWYIESLFEVEADMYYVLEVHVPGGGFF